MDLNQFAIVPVEVALDDRLGKMHIKVLIAVLSIRDRKADTVWVKREKIAQRCGYSEQTVSKVTSQLVELGWMEKMGRGGFSKPCEYRIKIPDFNAIEQAKTVSDSGTVLEGGHEENGVRTGNGSRIVQHDDLAPGKLIPPPSNHAASSDFKTVSEPGTVPESETVPDPGSKTVSEPYQKTVSGSDTGNIHTITRPIPDHKNPQRTLARAHVDPTERVVMSIDWQPNDYIANQLSMSGRKIPEFFSTDCLLYFRLHHLGDEKRHREFEKKFITWVIRDWEQHRNEFGGDNPVKPMTSDWNPADQVYSILAGEGMAELWIAQQLPEFRLYWIDKNVARDNWNYLFLKHCRYRRDHGQGAGADAFTRLTDRRWAT